MVGVRALPPSLVGIYIWVIDAGFSMLRFLTVVSAVLLILSAQAGMTAPAARWCGPPVKTGEASRITLAGILSRESVWGAPNFGEDPKHDRKETVWFISLNYPVPVLSDHEFGLKGELVQVRKLQLHVTVGQIDEMKPRLGRPAVVTGTLWTAVGPADVTPVTMQLARIEPPGAEIPTCQGKLPRRPT